MNEDIYKCRARLAIGLSLISGRSIQEVSAVIITSMGIPKLSSTYPIGISLDDMVLHVLCARPNLKLPAELKEYCAPNSEVIRLPLPQSWRDLVKVVENESGRRHPKVYENARQLLEELPDHLGISDKGIRSALGVELLARSGGDRGLLKVVTDSGGANLNNIIHYASYDQSQVEDMWRTVIEGWMEHPLPPLSQPLIPGARVGSPQGFLIEKVKQRIQIVKDLFDSAVKQKHWDAAFNHLMVYTVLWSNLATAGRKSKHPLPACVSDGWFYVNDKSRIDESTDRLVPYTKSMLVQLKVTLSFVDCISILHPEVVFNHDTRARIRHLKMSQDGVFIPFQPKFVDQHPGLKDLPANWARKLVRSESKEMIARFKDAGMGHIVMGRHPWSLYSTFDSMAFQKAWTSMQHRLEDELGFELLTVDGLPVPVDVLRNPEPRSDKCAAKSKDEKAILSVPEEELESLIEKHRHQGLEIYDQNGKASAEIIADAAKRIVMQWLKNDPDTAKAKAESLCRFIRTKYLVHLFVSKPRVRHRRAWLVSESEFRAFAQFELLIREPFQRDLEHLPDRTDVSADADPSMVELGRLLMIAIWRMGVLSIPQIEMLLTYLASEAPVLAIDDLRMIPLEVRCARTEELMKRTVFLEPYSAVYLTVERETLRAILRPILQEKPRQRTVRLQRALTAYLRFMNIESLLTLNEMVSAAKQSMMLKSAPVLAAYSAGQIYTVDLDDAELIRLSGRKGFKRKNTLLIQNNSIAGPDVHDDALSEMGQGLAKDFTSKLHGYRSPDPGEWIRRLSNTRAQSHIEVLLREFSIWLIGTMEAANASMKLDTRSRNSLSRNITIVGHALLHMAEGPKGGLFIDEVNLQQLQLQIEDHFKDRHLHAAWNALRRFLNAVKSGHYKQRSGSMIDESEPKLSDIKFGVIGEATEDQVSAKLLSLSEIQAIRASIMSVLSGIGNPLDSIAANRFLALLNATGMRRGEAVMLRSKDAMTDLCRVQPYGEFTLKTQSSERNLPYDFFDDELKQIIEQARRQSRTKIADPTRDREANGDNFFKEVAHAMQLVTEDPSIAPHHLRHTQASRMLISILRQLVNLDGIFDDMPWIEDLLFEDQQIKVLLGNELGGDHGLQAISAFIGHLHPSTTVRHYIHTLCILLYAFLKSQNPIDIEKAFERRISSRASRYRHQHTAIEARNHLEGLAETELGRRRGIGHRIKLVHHDFEKISDIIEKPIRVIASDPGSREVQLLNRIEKIDGACRTGMYMSSENLVKIVEALWHIANIPSGKRGSSAKRHPLVLSPVTNIPLPDSLHSGLAAHNALALIRYVLLLNESYPDLHAWFIHKWLYATDAQQGLIRMNAKDHDMLQRMPKAEGVTFKLEQASVTGSRQSTTMSKGVDRLRIGFPNTSANSTRITINRRSAGAVRWVMTWMAALSIVDMHDRSTLIWPQL